MVYLDHAALTPMRPEVLRAMEDAATRSWGNPDSRHAAGRRALARLEMARAQVAELMGCSPDEVVFGPSGRSCLERAIAAALAARPGPLVVSAIDHPSLVTRAEAVADREVRWLPLPGGAPGDGAAACLRGAAVVVVSALNHELGTALPIDSLRAHAPDAVFVIDAVQAAPWLPLPPLCRPATFLALSSQKLGGPPGVAALRVPPELGRDEGDRATSWLAAVGLGEACRLAGEPGRLARARAVTESLRAAFLEICPDAVQNGVASLWAGPILGLSLPGRASLDVSAALDLEGVCVARGTACVRQGPWGSPTVRAAYPEQPWRAATALRLSVGWNTGPDDVRAAAQGLRRVWAQLPRRSELEGRP